MFSGGLLSRRTAVELVVEDGEEAPNANEAALAAA